MIIIDGSYGEGGGQILRTALSLSLITGKPFTIEKIRAGRKKPGLLRQHLTALTAAKQISKAQVDGDFIGSNKIIFKPDTILTGNYHFSVGTAGSTTLILQTILPVLLTASSESKICLEGGTHNPFAPPFDFLKESFLSIINKLGPEVNISLKKYGFFPAGGGCIDVQIKPSKKLSKIELINRGCLLEQKVEGFVSEIPLNIAQDETEIVLSKFGWDKSCSNVFKVKSTGPGNIIYIKLLYENITAIFTGFGLKGIPLAKVALNLIDEVKNYLSSDSPVCSYLADQLLIPMAIKGEGIFHTVRPTQHTMTNIEIIRLFLEVNFSVNQINENCWKISIGGKK